MKTLHLSKTAFAGLVCLIMGIIVLSASFYLYEIDFQFDKKIRETPTNPAYIGPIRVAPYSSMQPYLTLIGSILTIIGVFLISYKKIKNGMKKK